jgi:phosphoglycolate phosphatase
VTLLEKPLPSTVQAVLFDLDGTLADTAADLAAAINKMRAARSLAPLPLEALRPCASAGARGLLKTAFNIAPENAGYEALREEFIHLYAANICQQTRLFEGIQALLDSLTARSISWGIVTNKVASLTEPLLERLGIAAQAGCIVSGDTTAHAKPHPAPLLHAARVLDIPAAAILYVGDDLRDIQAGHAADMLTIAAAYGYCGGDTPVHTWQAEWIVDSVDQLHILLNGLLCRAPHAKM